MVHVSVTGPVGGGQAGVFSDGRTDSVEVSLLKPVGSRRSCSGVRDWKSLGGQWYTGYLHHAVGVALA